ncbi:Putative SOS response-associated peptidase YedK [Nitrosospira briensis]|nr:Putative SOS response-associated peptidase YedK [Nitrosospira briensis]
MCGRFEQSETARYYASALGVDTRDHLKWLGGERTPVYNVAPGRCPWIVLLHKGELQFIGMTWGYRTPKEAADKKKPWICARVEKSRTGLYFRHMFREGRAIIPAGGWYEWTVENGKKQPWYITRKVNKPIFMAGLTNHRPYTHQTVEVGFVIVTEDSGAGMVDVHDRRPVVLESDDALRWMNPETPFEEAAHIAQTRSIPTEEFMWWKVDKAINRADPFNNGKHLLTPV